MQKNTILFVLLSIFLCACNKIKYNSPSQIQNSLNAVVKIKVEYDLNSQLSIANNHRMLFATGFSIANKDNISYILTNKHVCQMQSKAEYTLTTIDGTKLKAKFLLADTFADICLLQTNNVVLPLQLANHNAVTGERIIAMGAPDGVLPMIVDGFVSGYYEMHMKNDETDDAAFEVNFRAQVTSLPIYHGSSGSPVLNTNNEVVGIVFAVRIGAEHISFIVPVNEVIRFIDKSNYVYM